MSIDPDAFLENRPSRRDSLKWNEHDWFVLSKLRRTLAEHVGSLSKKSKNQKKLKVLDFGCADNPYQSLFICDVDYRSADLPGNENADVYINQDGSLPLPSEQFDVVLSTQVLEHVPSPVTYLKECRRVLKPDGKLILSTHGIWPYHADPVDYWRWTASGLERELEMADFSICKLDSIGGMLAVGIQLIQADTAWRLPQAVRGIYCYLVQRLVSLLDMPYREASRRKNAMVYVITAQPRQS